jgi:glyoxylase-like metal-dependent hydrolase (beta-lactamase superfamily II)
MTKHTIRWVAMLAIGLTAAASLTAASVALAQPSPSGNELLQRAATALGGLAGRSAVLGMHTLSLYGFGENNAQDGGGNVSASPHAPQKRTDVDGIVRTIDYDNGRMHLQQRQVQAFEFALSALMAAGNNVDQSLDGDVAWNVGGNPFNPEAPVRTARASDEQARARRIEMLDNPVSIVREGLAPGAQLGAVHTDAQTGDQVLDLITAHGDHISVAFSPRTHLPDWMRWVGPHPVYGDLTYTTWFTGYEPIVDGLILPFGYQTSCDYHDVVLSEVYVDKYEVNALSEQQRGAMAAPAAVRDVPLPAAPNIRIDARQVAPHVWYLHSSANGSSTVFDFTDHLTVFEAYGSEANFEAILRRIHEVFPGKPVTQLIVSHHHLDHTGGLRAAVAEGLTVITNRGENAAFVREVTSRPARMFPDQLQKKGRVGKVRVIPVDDRLVLKDANLEVDVLRIVGDSHMSDALGAYVPAAHTFSEGDLMDDTGWDASWWGNSYPDTVKYWHLQVDEDLPVHGHMHTYAEMMALTKKQTATSEALCAKADHAGFAVPGCPVANTMDGY